MNEESVMTSVLRHNIDLMKEKQVFRQALVKILRENGVKDLDLCTDVKILDSLREVVGDLMSLIQDVAAAHTMDEAWAQTERCHNYIAERRNL